MLVVYLQHGGAVLCLAQ